MLVRIAKNAVVAKLIDPDPKVKSYVNSLLSYEVEGRMMGGWDGNSSFYSVLNDTFPAGFVYLVQSELTKIGHSVQIVAKPIATPLGPENPIVDEFGNDNPNYDFQMKALRQVEKYGSGIIRVATGGGKSKIAKLIMSRFSRMTLFVTTRGILLYQMKDQLDEMGQKTGVIGDGQTSVVRGINMGMVQTLVQGLEVPSLDSEIRAVLSSAHGTKSGNSKMSRDQAKKIAEKKYQKKVKRRNSIIKFLEMIEVVIGEEAHEAGGNSYFEILKHCKNATIRVALTATPFMRDSAEDNMRLMAAFGPVLIDVPEDLLIQRGILAKPYFKYVDSKPTDKMYRTSPFERAYKLGYTENPNMHRDMLHDALNAQKRNMPILTLISRKNHGEVIKKLYENNGIRVAFLKGEDDMQNRKKQLARLAKGEIDCVIGTTILDVGVDVPAIALVQLAGGMKAKVSLRQRIGRGLRAKKSGPNVTFVSDYSCNTNQTLWDHAKMRKNIVKNIKGFAEGILEEGQDFPWAIFDPDEK